LVTAPESRYRSLDELDALDLDGLRLILRGSSVIDWSRLEFRTREDVSEFLRAHEFDLDDPASRARSEAIKNAAIGYLRRNFDFPIPRPVAESDVGELLLLASGRGHRQLCACTILKVLHIIHHLEARELLYMLPISDQEVFQLVEQKVRRVIGAMMARGLPIVEFVGGRKNKDALYSKLLSKKETHAAQIYDKLRFRVVTRDKEDLWPVLGYLTRNLFPFNYLVPGEATNTLFDFRHYVAGHPRLSAVARTLQPIPDERGGENANIFSAPSYRVVHFVCDLPVSLPQEILEAAPPAAWSLGRVVFAQAEFQIIDRETEQGNELGDASHDAYKARQKDAVMRRLKLGSAMPEPDERASPGIVAPVPEPPRARTQPPKRETRPAPKAPSRPAAPKPASPTIARPSRAAAPPRPTLPTRPKTDVLPPKRHRRR
jgi:uncharacterized protein (TIGR04552 family)